VTLPDVIPADAPPGDTYGREQDARLLGVSPRRISQRADERRYVIGRRLIRHGACPRPASNGTTGASHWYGPACPRRHLIPQPCGRGVDGGGPLGG